MKEKVILHIPYAILCALNDLRLGICRAYYMDWACASGIKKSTAASYWCRARKIFFEEKCNDKELIIYPNIKRGKRT